MTWLGSFAELIEFSHVVEHAMQQPMLRNTARHWHDLETLKASFCKTVCRGTLHTWRPSCRSRVARRITTGKGVACPGPAGACRSIHTGVGQSLPVQTLLLLMHMPEKTHRSCGVEPVRQSLEGPCNIRPTTKCIVHMLQRRIARPLCGWACLRGNVSNAAQEL